MQDGVIKIYNAVRSEKKGLTFTEIKKATGLSAPVISGYLKDLSNRGIIINDPETRAYTLAQIYYPIKDLPNDYQKALKIFAVASVHRAEEILAMRNKKSREEAFDKFLQASFSYFIVIVWKVIGESLTTLEEKNASLQNRAVQMNTIINRAFTDWIAPIANSIATAVALNIDLAPKIGDAFFSRVQKEAQEAFAGALHHKSDKLDE